MRAPILRRNAISVSSIAIILATAFFQNGYAQDVSDEEDEARLGTVVITGSRLETAASDSPAAVAVFDATALTETTGSISIGDQLAELPQFAPSSTRAASVSPTGGNSNTGLNLLDLRGIGASRTLVLVDGRRHVSSSQDTAQPDINTIPGALLERVEVLTGGASSVYGADAISGVVNFILRDDFEGYQVSARTGQSDESDVRSTTVSFTGGRNFANDRANIAASFEYSTSDILRYADRDFAAVETTIQGQNPLDTDVPGSPPDGIPDFITIEDLRRGNISNGGTVQTAAGFLQFNDQGSLIPVDFGSAIFPGLVTEGGSGLNGIESETLIPSQDRISLNVLGHYDLEGGTRFFYEGKVVQTETEVFSGAPFAPFAVFLDNPFLSADALATLSATTPPPFGPPVFVSNRVHRDIGDRGLDLERTTYRAVFGFEGQLADRFNYEISYNYGQTDTKTDYLNNAIFPRISLSADAVIDTAGLLGTPGAIVCRAQLFSGGATGNPDIDECVPSSFFGPSAVSDEARDYIIARTSADGKLTQQVLSGFMSTDTTGSIELPGGPISLLAGFEYRNEDTKFTPDPRDLVGDTVFAGLQAVDGDLTVAEIFGEAVAPVIKEQPGAELLEVRASVRAADYDLEGVGTKTSWGIGAVYAPVEDVRIRASYQEAVRAPNIAELFTPTTTSLTTTLDPCSGFGLSLGGPQRAANCAAEIPAGTPIGVPTFNLPVSQGGNPNLDVEAGTTFTAGLVFTPSALPGFSASIDYYDIELEDAIFSANPFSILALCYDAASTDNNPFCDAIERDPNTFELSAVEIAPVNATGFTAEGIDFELAYVFDFDRRGALAVSLFGNHILERNDFLDPLDPSIATQELETVGTPETRLNLSLDYSVSDWTIGWRTRYATSQLRTDPANVTSVNGNPPLNPDIFADSVLNTGDQYIHDLSVRYAVNDQSHIYGGIDNVTEPDLPPGIYGGGFGGANYDATGRYFYLGVTLGF